MEEVRDRYISFHNIDCYENATEVLDALYELFAPQLVNTENLAITAFMEIYFSRATCKFKPLQTANFFS